MGERSTAQCFSSELVMALVEGRLDGNPLVEAEVHMASCDDCLALVAFVAREEAVAESQLSKSSAKGAGGGEEPVAEWKPPREFDGFRVLRPLQTQGVMGRVWLAEDQALRRRVALKFIAAAQPDRTARESFQIEGQAMARIAHPNVLTLYRVGEVEGRAYLASEFVEGECLAALRRPVQWEPARRVGLGLARGLGAAHRAGIIHRDIKPENVVLTVTGQPKLLDFGLARFADALASKSFAGTPFYMSPEARRGDAPTRAGDVYSLGAVLYELCAGVAPRQAARRAAIEAGGDVSTDAPAPPLRALAPMVDADFAAVVDRCIAHDPADRFDSGDALCEALQRLGPTSDDLPLAAGNPYRGLQPFEAAHRTLFFGRQVEARALLNRLASVSLVLVAGDSGAGKSSLCRAGVLPHIADDARSVRGCVTCTMVPGRRPIEALAAALASHVGMGERAIVALVQRDSGELARRLRERAPSAPGIVLFINQLEELFTQASTADAHRFAEVVAALGRAVPGVRVLLAVRGDFLTRVASLPDLGDTLPEALFILRPLGPEAMRETIVAPARAVGVSFESEELVSTLVDDASREPGGLPLLQFALAESFEAHDPASRRITRAALATIGGVGGALARHGDEVLAALSPSDRLAARRALIRLVSPEGTRASRRFAELEPRGEPGRHVIEALVRGRLITPSEAGGEITYALAHEALIGSWGTLRTWLDDDAGGRALRHRVEIAAAEWERQGRREELLFRGRPLAEALLAVGTELAPRAQEFLAASRAAERRRRQGVIALLAAAPLAALGVWGGFRFDAHRFVAAKVGIANAALARGRALDEKAVHERTEAFALFDVPVDAEWQPRREHAEKVWADAIDLERAADESWNDAGTALEAALLRDGGDAEVRARMGEVLLARVRLAARRHADESDLRRRLVNFVSEAQRRALLDRPATVSITTTPPGARIEARRYVEDHDARSPGAPGDLGPSPRSVELAPGSWLLTVTAAGRPPVRFPLLVDAGEHRDVDIPIPARIPDGYAFVPPGCFLFGSSDDEDTRLGFLEAPPLHRVCTGGYLIGRFEVTFAEYIRWLDSLPPDERARRLPKTGSPGFFSMRLDPLPASAGWSLSLQPTTHLYQARSGEPLRYEQRDRRATIDWMRLPVVGVTEPDTLAFFAWLDATGRLPGARLCDEHEWERAARGADDRLFPNGDHLAPDDADFDETYGRRPFAYGPDEVGSHPASASPFGVEDLAGNVVERVTSVRAPGEAVWRGGSYYYSRSSARAANREGGDSAGGFVTVGIRACAGPPAL